MSHASTAPPAGRSTIGGIRYNLVLPESVAALPIFAELVVDDSAVDAPPAAIRSDLEIVVGDIVIRAGTDTDESHLTRAIRAARAAIS